MMNKTRQPINDFVQQDDFIALKDAADRLGIKYHTLARDISRHPERYVIQTRLPAQGGKARIFIHKSILENRTQPQCTIEYQKISITNKAFRETTHLLITIDHCIDAIDETIHSVERLRKSLGQ
jgi:hypothetical protein